MSVLTFREARESDIPQLVDIHQSALPNDFLPRLGRKFLTTIFFPIVLRASTIRVVVLEGNQSILSVLILSQSSNSLAKMLLSKKMQIVAAFIKCLIKNPSVLPEMISHLRGAKQQFIPSCGLTNLPDKEIWLIATRPDHQGRGYGAMILNHALPTGETIAAKTSSKEAGEFYRKFGFVPIGTEHRGSRLLEILLLDRRLQDGCS